MCLNLRDSFIIIKTINQWGWRDDSAVSVLAADLGLVPNTHMEAHQGLQLQFWRMQSLFLAPLGTLF